MWVKVITYLVFSFGIFLVVTIIAGGDAVNGKVEDGRCYFGSHGEYKEVSRAAYVLSAGYIMIGTFSVAFFVLFAFGSMVKGGGLRIQNLKENPSDVLIFVVLLFGLGWLYASFISLQCILKAFGII